MRTLNTTRHWNPAAASPHAPSALIGLAARLAASVRRARRRVAERRELLAMDERELRDIGVTAVEAWREAEKSIWHD